MPCVSSKKSSGPLSTSKKGDTNVPTLCKESSGPEIVRHQQTVSTIGKFGQKNIGAASKKDEKPNRRIGKDEDLVKKKKKKGEVNLGKLRNQTILNDTAEKQLLEICRKGKLFETALHVYINKSVAFQDLDFKLFVAGELEIISSRKIKIDERNIRLSFLKKKIVCFSNIYQCKALLDYAAFLRQIEGVLKLGKIIQVI